jgi:hypothetical protein
VISKNKHLVKRNNTTQDWTSTHREINGTNNKIRTLKALLKGIYTGRRRNKVSPCTVIPACWEMLKDFLFCGIYFSWINNHHFSLS